MRKVAFCLLWLYVFTLPWDHMLDLGNGIGEISRVLGLLSTAATLALVLAGEPLRKPAVQHLLAAALLITIVASWFWSTDQDATARSIRTCLQTMVVMWTVWQLAQTTKKVSLLLFSYVLGAYVSCLATIDEYWSVAIVTRGERFTAEGWNANDLAVALALAIPMAAYLASTTWSRSTRWCCWAYFLIGPTTIALTASRAGAVVGVLALLAALIISMHAGWRVRLATLTLVALTATILLTFIPITAWDRIASISSSPDMNDRVPVWQESMRLLAKNPYRPLGAGASASAIGGQGLVAHNSFLSVLLDDGIVGLTCFVGVIVSTFAGTRRLTRTERWLWCSLLLCWAVGAMTLSWEQVRVTWFLFACATAAVHSSDRARVVEIPAAVNQEMACAS